MRVELNMEQHGDQLGRRARCGAAGLGNRRAARLVMGDQLLAAGVQAVERQLVPRQHQGIGRDLLLQLVERADVEPERIALWIDGPHADVGRDLGQHLIGGEKDIVGRAVEHHLLRGVAVAGQHVEAAPADLELVAGNQPHERRRQARHHPQVIVALGGDALGRLGVEAVAQVEVAIGLGIERTGAERDVGAAEIAGLAGQQGQAEALAQPAGKADVVGVEVRHDQAGQAPARQGSVDQRTPNRPRRLVADARVEHGPAVAVVDQVDVDVVQPKGERDARPQNAGGDLDDLARRRRLRRREGQGAHVGLGEHRLRSSAFLLR